MRKVLLVCSLILCGGFTVSTLAAAPTLLGKDAPDFVLKARDGRNLRMSEFRGQVVLVNFWARWAGDSRQEMPALDRINPTYQRAGHVVLGLSVDEGPAGAVEFATERMVWVPVVFERGSHMRSRYLCQNVAMLDRVEPRVAVRSG